MSFLDKLKKSVNEASTIAKVTVEVNRLKLQISSHKKEIADYEAQIGKLIYEQYTNNELDPQHDIIRICKLIEEKHEEIAVVSHKINELNGEKLCQCGQTLPKSTRFCPTCGHKFEVDQQSEASVEQSEPLAIAEAVESTEISSKTENDAPPIPVHIVCVACSEVLEPDSKFCNNCGTAIE